MRLSKWIIAPSRSQSTVHCTPGVISRYTKAAYMRRIGLRHSVLGFCASCPSISGEKNISVIEADALGVTLLSASASMESGMTGAAVDVWPPVASGVNVEAGARGDGVCVAVGGTGVAEGAFVASAGRVSGLPGPYTFTPITINNTAEPTSHQPATTRSRR